MTEAAAWRLVTRGSLYVAGLIAAVWLIVELQSLVLQVFVALVMACASDPIVNRIMSIPRLRLGNRRLGRGPVAITVFALGGLLVLAVTLKLASAVVGELAGFAELSGQESTASQQLTTLANQVGIPTELVAAIGSAFHAALDWLVQLVGVLLGAFSSFLSVVFTVIIAIYLASDTDRILRSVVSWLPVEHRQSRVTIDATLRLTGQRLGRWVLAQVIVASIVSLLWAIGLHLLGIPYVGLLSLIAFLSEFIPLVGPFISSVPTIFVAITATTPSQAVATAVFCLIVEQIENDWLVPRIMSSATTVHPLVVLLSILAGGQLLGPIGALLAVPLATCISVFLTAYRQGEDIGNNAVPEAAAELHDPPAVLAPVHVRME